MTTPPPLALYDELRDLANRFTERGEIATTLAEADEWGIRAGQLRLTAALVSTADPVYVEIGEAFRAAGKKLLAPDLALARLGGACRGR